MFPTGVILFTEEVSVTKSEHLGDSVRQVEVANLNSHRRKERGGAGVRKPPGCHESLEGAVFFTAGHGHSAWKQRKSLKRHLWEASPVEL